MRLALLIASICTTVAASPSFVKPTLPGETQPIVSPPGPLQGGNNGAQFLGPGFQFRLPAGWSIVLDDLREHQGLPGERGTARPAAGSKEDLAGASIRFEPFPLEPGAEATLEAFEAHVRRTLALGVNVAVIPLVSDDDAFHPHVGEAQGLTFWFARPEPDAASQRRYFVYALPRADGRLQTIICSHLGNAAREFSAVFTGVGRQFSTEWPDNGGVYRRPELGVVIQIPQGWRPANIMYCGTGLLRQDPRTVMFPLSGFTRTDGAREHAKLLSGPVVHTHFVEEFTESLDMYVGPGAADDPDRTFIFADGRKGLCRELANSIDIVRMDGRRLIYARASEYPSSERENVFALLRGIELVPSTPEETPSSPAKVFTTQGMSITYPGAWKLSMSRDHMQSGSLEPIEDSSRLSTPELRFWIGRLDDLLAEHERRVRSSAAPSQNGGVICHDRSFSTPAGLKGFEWNIITTARGRRGGAHVRNIEYVIPMPDGVAALCLTGMTTTIRGNDDMVKAREDVWRWIARGVRFEPSRP